MNDKHRRNLESGQRCRQWAIDYVALVTPGSPFAAGFVELTTLVNTFETLAGQLEALKGEGLGATDVKGSERQELLDLLEPVRAAARSADYIHPGMRDRYRYAANMSHQALLAAGRGFAINGQDDKDLLITYKAPDDWPNLITTACDEYEASFGAQDSAQGGRVATNAELNEVSDNLNTVKKHIGHMIPNFCSGNTGAIAAWATAAHVEKPPEKKTPPAPPTP